MAIKKMCFLNMLLRKVRVNATMLRTKIQVSIQNQWRLNTGEACVIIKSELVSQKETC